MNKKNLMCILIIFLSLALLSFVACNNNNVDDGIIRGKISDVVITVNETDYDFYNNVSFVDDDGKNIDFLS